MTTPDPKSLKAALDAIDWDALAVHLPNTPQP
jgi:hypothetical protein